MGVKAPFLLGCEELGERHDDACCCCCCCDRGGPSPADVGEGDLVERELLELFPPVARIEGDDGGSGERVK
jgi:hypothetical protein